MLISSKKCATCSVETDVLPGLEKTLRGRHSRGRRARGPRADTNECGVSVAQIHRDRDAVLLLLKKDLRPVENEEVHLVRVDVGRLINEDAREHVGVRIRL